MQHSTLVIVAALAVVFALSMYVLLDGFDLGIGVLTKFFSPSDRDLMIESIAPVWDGNETWLVMAGVALWAAFPVAYGTLLPAFYVPLLGMLLCLGMRGVSFEFREHEPGESSAWDIVFWMGSLGATFLQGSILGGLLHGLTVSRQSIDDVQSVAYSGGALDFLTYQSAACGVLVMISYVVLGSGWLRLKTTGHLRLRAEQIYGWSLLAFAVASIACLSYSFYGNEALLGALSMRAIPVSVAFFVGACAGLASLKATQRVHYLWTYVLSALTVGAPLLGVVAILWPYIVPFQVTIEQASSPTGSLVFLLIGMVAVVPVILSYTYLAYWVFRERVGELEVRPA